MYFLVMMVFADYGIYNRIEAFFREGWVHHRKRVWTNGDMDIWP